MSKIKEFFSFNKAERRGVFVLLLIISVLIIYRIFGPFSIARLSDQNTFQHDIDNFLKTLEEPDEEKKVIKRKGASKTQNKKAALNLHPFDPNVMSYNQWLKMGLSEYQARTIEKYKSKGGKFKDPNDFSKIYCISDDEFEEMLPFIIINLEENNGSDNYELPEPKFDLNSVDMIAIQRIRGIGPAFAKRIIKYREILGGYVNINQLMEVYGMDSIRYRSIQSSFTLSLDSIRTIPLNTSSYKQLRRHPYVSDQLAYEIAQFRDRHGAFKEVEDLKKIKLVNDSLFEKINLYFVAAIK